MRANFTAELEHRVRRIPMDAREIVEAVTISAEDVIKRSDQWQARADSLTGFSIDDRDRVQLSRSGTTPMDQTTSDDDFLLFGRENTTFTAAKLTYTPAAFGRQISQITANLDPDEDGVTGQDVSIWKCQLWQLMKEQVSQREGATLRQMHLQPVEATAGPAAGAVNFAFTHDGNNPVISPLGLPVVYVQIWGIQSDGSPATNVGWQCSTAIANPFADGGADLTAVGLQLRGFGWFEGALPAGEPDAVPTLVVTEGSYSAATVTFSSDPFDLGAAPTDDVELTVELDVPFGTSAVSEWRTSTGPDVWTAFVDGDLAGVDNTPRGGTDLSAFAATQTYVLRVTLTPNADADRTPALVAIGVRELEITDLDGLVRIESEDWHCDPVTMHATSPRVTLAIQHDGLRDYQDLASRLLSQNHIADIEFRIWWGHPDLARNKWMLWDTLWITGPVTGLESELRVTCATPLSRLVHVLPIGETSGAATREAFVQTNVSLQAASVNIRAEISLPDRYDGPHTQDTTTLVSKRITGSRAKAESDHVCFIAGGTLIASQGRLRYRQMFDSVEGLVAIIPREEVRTLSVSPGWERRVPVVFLKYDWDDAARGFASEGRYVHANSLAALGRTFGQSDEFLEEAMTRWIVSDTVADTVGERHVKHFGLGVILWQIATTHHYPEVEIGDVLAVETDTFVARDPNSTREIVGRQWGIGKVVKHNREGNRFTLWLPSYADIVPSATVVNRGELLVTTVRLNYDAFQLTDTASPIDKTNGDLRPSAADVNQFGTTHVPTPPGADSIIAVRQRSLTGDGATDQGVVAILVRESVDGTETSVTQTQDNRTAGTWLTSDFVVAGAPPISLTDGSSLRAEVRVQGQTSAANARLLWFEVDFAIAGG